MKKYEDMNKNERRIYNIASELMDGTIDTASNKAYFEKQLDNYIELITKASNGDLEALNEYGDLSREYGKDLEATKNY